MSFERFYQTKTKASQKHVFFWHISAGSEIKEWHDRFYEQYPAGVITHEEFISMYEDLFPKGDSRRFAEKIFKVCIKIMSHLFISLN